MHQVGPFVDFLVSCILYAKSRERVFRVLKMEVESAKIQKNNVLSTHVDFGAASATLGRDAAAKPLGQSGR